MRRARGYSLVELLMVVAIIGAVAMVGPQLMIQMQSFYLLTAARSEIQRDARATIDIINRFIRQAKYSTIHIDTPANEGPYSRIRFTMVDDRNVEFYQDGQKLMQKVDGVTNVISRNLVYVAFTFPRSDYPKLVSVSLTTGKSTYKGQRKELELTVQKIRVMN